MKEIVTLGFTGTSSGMTPQQLATVRRLFMEMRLMHLHHGDCIGADAQAHYLARELGAYITVHPPSNDKLRAFCPGGEGRKPVGYLTRNRHIVAEGIDGLVVAPKDYQQPKNLRGQGTWTTLGYARQAGRRVWIVFPDGTYTSENPSKTEN